MSLLKNRRMLRPLLAMVGAGIAAGAAAQTPPRLKAGLWEHSVTMRSQSGQLEAGMQQAQAALASMPPDQRKMMEELMAKQGVGMGAGGQKVRLCMSPEDVARDEPPPAQDGCTQKASRKGNTWTVSFRCPARDGEPPSSGEGTVTLQSATAYSGDFVINTHVDKKAERVTMRTEGGWVAADCGAIKPVR